MSMPLNGKIPYLLTCPLSSNDETPVSVSLVMEPCQTAENDVKIIDNQPESQQKKEFGVCLKQLNFEDKKSAFRFIEWVHLMKILGVDKIHGFTRSVHPDILKAVKSFTEKGWMEMKPVFAPLGSMFVHASWETRALELMLLNDCFYRNLNLYKYIIVIDTDEVIMPVSVNTTILHDLIETLDPTESIDNYYFPYGFFKTSRVNRVIPDQFFMLQHVMVKI
jgi:hypothetical protein